MCNKISLHLFESRKPVGSVLIWNAIQHNEINKYCIIEHILNIDV